MSTLPEKVDVKNLTLITGGARSGKSSFAEMLADRSGEQVLYIATMEEVIDDGEAVERIKRHRERRPNSWRTLEVPFHVHAAIAEIPRGTQVCLIDCLSLYVSNMLLDLHEKVDSAKELEDPIQEAAANLLMAMSKRPEIRFIVVTNEVGWGIVPEHKLARSYRDLLGIVNQQFAQSAGEVWLSCVGLQLKLK